MSELLTFNKWSTKGITVADPGVAPYISLEPRIVPRSGGKHTKTRFHKSKVFIVERFMNHLMVTGHTGKKHTRSSGHNSGKGNLSYNTMLNCLNIIEQKTKENPIAVLVAAIENAAPREEIITIEYGGARYPKAVEMAPSRRVDYAIRQMIISAATKSFSSKKDIETALADELLAASKMSNQSSAISKKFEMERQADSSR